MNTPLYEWQYYEIKITKIWMAWAPKMLISRNIIKL